MTVTYTRDLEHNYMRITGEGMAPDAYALKMCRMHTIPYLVPAEVRESDGEISLYYVTDALMSLTNRCLVRRLHVSEVRGLLCAMRTAEEALIDYLLDIGTLYLTPETVFLDGQGCWRFTGLPYAQTEGTLTSFLSALCALVDPEDEEAVQLCRTLCACAAHGAGRLRDLMRYVTGVPHPDGDLPGEEILQERGGASRRPGQAERNAAERVSAYGSRPAQEDIVRVAGGGTRTRARRERPERRPAPLREEASAREVLPEDRQAARPGVITILFAAVLLADVYVRKEYVLTSAGNLLSIAVMLLSLIGAVGSCFMGGADGPAKNRKRQKKRGAKRGKSVPQSASRPRRRDREEVPDYLAQMAAQRRYEAADDEEEYTTLLNDQAPARGAKLYGKDGDTHRHIDLSQLPLTLGRGSAEAGVVLRDPSVSRLHAHILKDADDRIILRDLNSANGTFLNGVRLAPNESVPLTIGDEVCFGGAVFDYV